MFEVDSTDFHYTGVKGRKGDRGESDITGIGDTIERMEEKITELQRNLRQQIDDSRVANAIIEETMFQLQLNFTMQSGNKNQGIDPLKYRSALVSGSAKT